MDIPPVEMAGIPFRPSNEPVYAEPGSATVPDQQHAEQSRHEPEQNTDGVPTPQVSFDHMEVGAVYDVLKGDLSAALAMQ